MGYTFFCPTKLIISENAGEDLVNELKAMPEGKVFVITDEGIMKAGVAKPILDKMQAAGFDTGIFTEVPGNPNVPDVEKVVAAARKHNTSQIVAIGGGSVIDTAKAVALILGHGELDYEAVQWRKTPITKPSLPYIAIPTTAGTGSEMTHVAVIGDSKGFKMGVLHPALFAYAAIIDGSLMKSLPANLTAATGMDVLVHAIEAFLGKRANPCSDFFALAAIKDCVRWLPEATKNGSNLAARQAMAQAASWAGLAFDQSGLGLVHALAGPLCQQYHLHHGLGVAVLLPATLAYDAEAITEERWESLKSALNMPTTATPADLQEWAETFMKNLNMPIKLSELGVEKDKLAEIASSATRMAMIGNNVRSADEAACKQILEAAL